MARTSGLQRGCGFAAAAIEPNLVAVLAWGLAAALFMPDGPLASARVSPLVGTALRYLLPLLIGAAGGRRVDGARGALLGALAAAGLAAGTEVPVVVPALLAGPLVAWLGRALARAPWPAPLRRAGAEVFPACLGVAALWAGTLAAGPLLRALGGAALAAAAALVKREAYPLLDLVLAPARLLFLDHDLARRALYLPGFEAVASTGRSIHFLLPANPGPLLGVLLAIGLAGSGPFRRTAPVAAAVQALGGVPAVGYFYVLGQPLLLLAWCAGGVASGAVFTWLRAGLVGAAAPPSLRATLALTPPGLVVQLWVGLAVGFAVSFATALFLLRRWPAAEAGAPAQPPGAAPRR